MPRLGIARLDDVLHVDAGADPAQGRTLLRGTGRHAAAKEPAIGPVLAAQAVLDLERLLGGAQLVPDRQRPGPVVRMQRLAPAEAHQRLGRHAGKGLQERVGVVVAPVGIGGEQHQRQRFGKAPEARLAFAEGRLVAALLGQIQHRPEHAHRLAAVVADHMAAVENVRIAAVGAQEAVFVDPAGLRPVDRRMDAGVDPGAVLRVDMSDPPFPGRLDIVRPVTIGGLQRLVPEHVIGGEVPIPDRVVGGPDRQAVALGGFPRHGLGLLLLGHVAEEHGEPVLDRIGPCLDPDSPAVGPDVAMLQRDRDPLAHRLLVLAAEFAVLGSRIELPMQAPEQFFAWAAFDPLGLDIEIDDPELPVEQREALAHPVENALGAGLALAQAAFGQHLAGDLVAGTEEAGDGAGLVAHGGVGEAEMRLFDIAAALDEQRDVVHVDRLARIGLVDDRHEVGADLLPHFQKVAAERCGVLRCEDLGIGIVVEQRAVRPPGDEHGLVRRQHDADQRLQRRRPVPRRPERRFGPRKCAQAFARGAAAGQKCRNGRRGVANLLICHALNIASAHPGHQLVPAAESAIPAPLTVLAEGRERRLGEPRGANCPDRVFRRPSRAAASIPRIGHRMSDDARGRPGGFHTRLSIKCRACFRPRGPASLAECPRGVLRSACGR